MLPDGSHRASTSCAVHMTSMLCPLLVHDTLTHPPRKQQTLYKPIPSLPPTHTRAHGTSDHSTRLHTCAQHHCSTHHHHRYAACIHASKELPILFHDPQADWLRQLNHQGQAEAVVTMFESGRVAFTQVGGRCVSVCVLGGRACAMCIRPTRAPCTHAHACWVQDAAWCAIGC